MAVRLRLQHAEGTDMGRRRTNNEDRLLVDADLGVFGVIDGVGGQAAGEQAADTARDVILARLRRPTGTPEERLREAITLANNEIFEQATTHPEWAGMACVLTVALIEDDMVTFGHVGDSRLYLLQPGRIEKKTHDHSPVGEREDRGELEELDAMRHARRNEIYRDVGSGRRELDDPAFIEIDHFPLPHDGALLFCSDGLTDLITKEEIRAGLERYAPEYGTAIAALIDAANHAGGKDNITVVVVAAPGYDPHEPDTMPTRAMARRPGPRRWIFALAGLTAGALAGFFTPRVLTQLTPRGPMAIPVGPGGINAALNLAHPGDAVLIPPGTYPESVQLREGVDILARQPDSVVIAPPDGAPAIVARNIARGSIEGVRVDGAGIESSGIEISDASPTISNVRVSGAQTGILVRGKSEPYILNSQIEHNLGAGIVVEAGARARIEHNVIAGNGDGKPGPPKPGVEVADTAHPIVRANIIVNNAAEPEVTRGQFEANYFGPKPDEKPALKEKPKPGDKK
jgi:serine/threonine protein phosphatase PrpC